MAIKIYQSQIAPTKEVSERQSTRGMRVSLDDATRPARALKGMLQAGEDFYVQYEKTKSENEVLEKSKEVEFGVKGDNGETVIEGLGSTKTKVSEYADPDKAMSEYKQNWQNTKDRILPTLKGRYSKRLFNTYMDKQYLSDKSTIQSSNVRGMLYKNRTLKIQTLEPLYKILSTSEKGSNEYNQAETQLQQFFLDEDNKKLFGAKFSELEFTAKATIDILRFKKDVDTDPINTYIKFQDTKNYSNLPAEKRIELESSAKRYAQSFAQTELKDNYAKAIKGETGKYKNSELLEVFKGDADYDKVLEQAKINDIVFENANIIKDAKYGEESKLIRNIKVTGENIKYKEKAKQAIENAIIAKNKAIQNDAAGYYIEENEDVEQLTKEVNTAFENYIESESEDDLDVYNKKFNERADFLDNIYEEKNIPKRFRTYITQSEAKGIVAQYKGTANPEKQSGLIESLKLQYGNRSSDVFMQLQKEGLPFGAMMSASVNNPNLKNDINDGAINIKAYETKYKNAEQATGTDLNAIKFKISDKLEDYTQVITNQPGGSVNASGFINGLEESIYHSVMSKYNRGEKIDDAIASSTREFLNDYQIADSETFWVPADVNGQAVSQQHILAKTDVIMDKIKNSDYLNQIDLRGIDDKNKEIVINDIKNNSNFYLNPQGDGVILFVERNDGTPIPVSDKAGNLIEVKFLDNSTVLPITNIPFQYDEMYDDPALFDETYIGD